MFIKKRIKDMNIKDPIMTSWMVSGLGLLVSTLGASMVRRKKIGAGILGFGLAHVLLGQLDRFRPAVKDQ